jgi:hypothetical protein
MRFTTLAAVVGLAALACGKSPEARARDVGICSDTADGGRIAACLRGRGWDSLPSESAGAVRAVELDSMFRWQSDSTWQADQATHAADLERCAPRRGDLAQCLRLAGWPAELATAVAESLWNTRAEDHQRQVERCAWAALVATSHGLMRFKGTRAGHGERSAGPVTRMSREPARCAWCWCVVCLTQLHSEQLHGLHRTVP